MMESSPGSHGPRPLVAFFASLGICSLLFGFFLLTDRRLVELKRARAEIRELDRHIAAQRRENEELQASIEAARHHEFPAEKVAREDLQLAHPEDLVLLYPPGSLSGTAPTPAASVTPSLRR